MIKRISIAVLLCGVRTKLANFSLGYQRPPGGLVTCLHVSIKIEMANIIIAARFPSIQYLPNLDQMLGFSNLTTDKKIKKKTL